MTLIEAYNNIKKNYPNLVEYLIKRSLTESESERQTIYGDLSDWIRDYHSDLSLSDKDMLAKLILGDYVIKKGSFSTKVDLEKGLSEVWRGWANEYDISFVSYKKIAKHFFELGLKAQKGE